MVGWGYLVLTYQVWETSLSSRHPQTAPPQQSLVLCWLGLWGHSLSRKEGHSKESKGDFCLWRGKKEKSFILIPKNHHLRNYEKLPRLATLRRLKIVTYVDFQYLCFFFLEQVSIPPTPLDCAFNLFFFFSRMKILHVQLNQTIRKCSTKRCFLSPAPYMTQTNGERFGALACLGTGRVSSTFHSIFSEAVGLFKLCLDGKFYTKQKWYLLQNQF